MSWLALTNWQSKALCVKLSPCKVVLFIIKVSKVQWILDLVTLNLVTILDKVTVLPLTIF